MGLRTEEQAVADERETAMVEFRRVMKLIGALAVVMVIGALAYLHLFSTLDTNTVLAVTLGVFFSMLLGCGLFAAAFFSDKSGHDQRSTDATKTRRGEHRDQD